MRCTTCGSHVRTVRESRGRDRGPATYTQSHDCVPFEGCDVAAPIHRRSDGTLCPSPRHKHLDTPDET